MSTCHLQAMKKQLRHFFRHRKRLMEDVAHARLMEVMSPKLKADVANLTNSDWLSLIGWAMSGSAAFRGSLALKLKAAMYTPTELIEGTKLTIVTRGVVIRNKRIISRGLWGTDMILANPWLKDGTPARALTFTTVYSLDDDQLRHLLEARLF